MRYDDVMVIEGAEGHEAETQQEYAAAVQRMINAGQWSLQGSFGRTMMQMIEDGQCLLGHRAARDYWGNGIPARDEVVAGTKGSLEYVAAHMGQDWAEAMAAIA